MPDPMDDGDYDEDMGSDHSEMYDDDPYMDGQIDEEAFLDMDAALASAANHRAPDIATLLNSIGGFAGLTDLPLGLRRTLATGHHAGGVDAHGPDGGPDAGADDGPNDHMDALRALREAVGTAAGLRFPTGMIGGYGSTRITRIVRQLQDHDNVAAIIPALQQLSEFLLVSRDEVGYMIPPELVTELVSLLKDPAPNPEVLVMSARAVSQLIDSGMPNAVPTLVDAGIIDALRLRFEDIGYIDVVEQAISIMERVAAEYPSELLQSGSVLVCLQYLDFFNQHIQKTILNIVGMCCATIEPSSMENAKLMVPVLEMHLENANPALADLAVGGMAQLVLAISKRSESPAKDLAETIHPPVWSAFLTRVTPGSPQLSKVLRALSHLAQNLPQFALELLEMRFAATVGYALTSSDVSEPVEPATVLSTLLHCPKDTLVAGLKLLQVLIPSAYAEPDTVSSPCRRITTVTDFTAGVPERVLMDYATVTARLCTLMYPASVDLWVRERVLLVLVQIAAKLTGPQLVALTKELDIGSFVSTLVSQADVAAIRAGGLDLALELVTKAPQQFLHDLARKGLKVELEELAVTPEPEKRHYLFTEDNTNVAGYLARELLAIYDKHPEYSGSTDSEEARRVVKALESLSGDLSGHPIQTFKDAAGLAAELSPLELQQHGFIAALARAIPTNPGAFLEAFGPAEFGALVDKALDALSRSERLGVLASSSSNSVQSMVSALTRPVNIRLKEEGGAGAWSLKVQSIAAINVLETFCRRRGMRLNNANFFDLLGTNDRDTTPHDDDDDEDDDEDVENAVEVNETHHSEHSDGFEDTDEELDHEELDHELDHDEHSDHHHSDDGGDYAFEHSSDEEDENADVPIRHRAGNRFHLHRGDDGHDDDAHIDEEIHGDSSNGLFTRGAQNGEGDVYNFTLNGKPLHRDMSIVGAIFRSLPVGDGDMVIPRSVWTDTYTIKFSRSSEETVGTVATDIQAEQVGSNGIPKSFGESVHLANSLKLLQALWDVNMLHARVAVSRFVSTKLTAKLNRQLEDPLIVASSILPQWTVDVVRLYPFLLPFEARYLFVQSTSFGYSRSMARWQALGDSGVGENFGLGPQGAGFHANNDSQATARAVARTGVLASIGRPVKQKYRIPRNRILAGALNVLQLAADSPAVVEVEFYNEEGTGLGPTQEFYANASRDFTRVENKMWRGTPLKGSPYTHDAMGLFPAPIDPKDKGAVEEQTRLFNGLGRFVARALMDQRIMDLPLNPAFFVALLRNSEGIKLEQIDAQLAASLGKLDASNVDSLELCFTLPGYDIELVPHGATKVVTKDNMADFVRRVSEYMTGAGIETQLAAFKEGFSESVPLDALEAFLPSELCAMCGQSQEDWSIETLRSAIKADHGYTMDSRHVCDLIEVMTSFSFAERRAFLQFMTGSPNLPIGGFKALQPAFTVVLKHPDNESLDKDDYLPSVMTCVNYVKLPEYSSKEIMAERLRTAISEGSGSFPLS